MPLLRVRSWAYLKLPRSLAVYVAAVIAGDVILLTASAAAFSFRAHDLELFGVLLACNAATVELTRRTREPEGHLKDVHAVWELPVVILLPLLYALLMPLIRLTLTQWRVRQAPLYRRMFSACAISVSYACASLAFHGVRHEAAPGPLHLESSTGVTAWLVVVAACAVVQLVVNQGLVFAAVRAASPRTAMREFLLGRPTLRTDLTETCMAVLSTLAIAVSPFTVVVALPLATLLQRSAVHGQLVKDARTDSKTGLLNAATWERGATAEIARAVRTRTPLAVALLDIDRFKVINDTYGHLTGDVVLKEIAHTLMTVLRDYDLAGRFGGEEFAVLLPQTRAVDALRIAERVRAAIAGLPIIAPGATGGERVHVTVSIGVAALDSGSKREFGDLMRRHRAELVVCGNHYGFVAGLDHGALEQRFFAVETPQAVRGRRAAAVALTRAEDLILTDPAAAKAGLGTPTQTDDLLGFVRRQAADATAGAEQVAAMTREKSDAAYPATALGRKLQLVARMLKAGAAARVFYTSQGGYDTHAQQANAHSFLLSEFAGAVAAFFADLSAAKGADRVVLVAFSEFGRTIAENDSAGTDHGTAGCVFVAGSGVRGGVRGTQPSLTELTGGEPKMTTDFRGVYSALLTDWLNLSADGLGDSFAPVKLFG